MNVVVVDMQPITPAVGGGRLRLLGLYHSLGKDISVNYVGSYDWDGESLRDQQLTPGLREICVPLSKEHHAEAARISTELGGAVVIDSAFSMQANLSPEWVEAAASRVSEADVVVFSHPWAYGPLRDRIRADQLIVYDSQNVESVLKYSLLAEREGSEKVLREVVRTEFDLCHRADLIAACSQDDVDTFARLFDVSYRKMRVVPNGTFTDRTTAKVTDELRSEVRASLDLASNAKIAVFVGSNYGPNVDAAKWIADTLCRELPEIAFVIVGGVGDCISASKMPFNLRVTGQVDDERRDALLKAADVAINPMNAGSGTNIKMFDFLSAGLPVVTTEIGARGICDASSAPPFIFVQPMKGFAKWIETAIDSRENAPASSESPEQYVRRLFSWERISPELGRLFQSEREKQLAGKARRKAWLLSTWGIRCGIGEHSSHFADAMADLGWDVLVLGNSTHGHHRTGFSQDMHFAVSRIWNWDNTAWKSGIDIAAFDTLLKVDRPELVVIQHHTAFMPVGVYREVLQRLAAAKIRVVMELHDARHVDADVLADYIRSLDLLVLHDAQEMDVVPVELRQRVIVQALPTPAQMLPAEETQIPREAGPVVSGFGFLRPYKGLLTTVRAMAELRDRVPGVRYRGFHALYDAESSQHLLECRSEAERLGVSDIIEIDTNFHPRDHVIHELAQADVILLPYAPSNEGASAAANYVLAAGRAMVVSSAKIFHPVRDVVRAVDGQDPKLYAQAVYELLSSPSDREKLEQAARDWARSQSYPIAIRSILAKAA